MNASSIPAIANYMPLPQCYHASTMNFMWTDAIIPLRTERSTLTSSTSTLRNRTSG
uniref:Uncharacterized protein n=1 Tax=Rhizophora mucronata TaxID=61149 RepID=A0A2P2QCE1_RHIMU